MRLRFPLSAKIIAWLCLNLLLLALSFMAIFSASFGFDAVFGTLAKPRVMALATLVESELKKTPRQNWDDVLARYTDAYKMQMMLFNPEGTLLAGKPMILPPSVQEPLDKTRPPPHPRPPPPRPGSAGETDNEPPPQEKPATTEEVSTLFFLRTSDPLAYWACARIPLFSPATKRFRPATLIMRSDTLSAGGLFFDPKPWIIAGCGAVFLSMLLWYPLVRGITRSFKNLTAATARIAEGDFTLRVPENRRDEIGDLGSSINTMADRLVGHANEQKRFLGDIAHELCSPLARMQATAGLIEHQISLEVNQRYAQRLARELRHMSDLVSELLSFSKAAEKRNIELQPVKLAPLLQRVLDREAAFDAPLDDMAKLEVLAEPELLARAIGNVLRNAIRYAGEDVPIHIEADTTEEHVTIRISDEGPGVPPEALPRLFDAFYRPDPARARETGGAGLGLAIVKSCVEACQGTVSVKNRTPHGLEVSIQLINAHAS
jgi:two-component system sensor histidine kinase CpxA